MGTGFRHSPRKLLLTALVLGVLALHASAPAALAASRTWTGGGSDNNWTNAANWGGTAPVAGDSLVFPAGAARLTNTNNFPAGTQFLLIGISGSGYVLGGNSVALSAGLVTTHVSGTVTVNLAISGTGSVVVSGAGRLILSGANSFTGEVRLEAGSLRVKHASALGSVAGGTIVQDAAGLDGGLEIEGSFTIGESILLSGSGHALLSHLSGNSTITADVNVSNPGAGIAVLGGQLRIDGDITTAGIFKTGPGTLVLNGNVADYLDLGGGVTTVNGAVAGRIDLAPGAMLQGTGSGARLVAAGGLFAPGPGGPGVFTVNGPVQMNAATRFGVVIIGTSFSQLVTAGRPSLGGAELVSDVENQPPPPVGSVAMIVKNNSVQSVLGTFKNLPEGSTYTEDGVDFKVSYVGGDGNDVTLTALGAISADVRVAVSTSPEPVVPGGILTYTIVVSNFGPSDATGLQMIAPVVQGVAFVSAQAPADWACTVPPPGSTGQLRCSRGTLPSGLSSTFTLTVRVDIGRAEEVSPRIVVLSGTPDPLAFNNQAQAVTHISGGPVTTLAFKRVLPMVSHD